MDIEVSYTPDFERQLKRLANKYPSIYKDLDSVIDNLEVNPQSGESLGKNLYKVRMPISSKSKGKSGGARVISYVLLKNNSIYLAAIYDKSEQSTIDTQRLLKVLRNLGL
ncbi:type II toxin-antitoxin system RelE family toxin [Mucilaginibacter flavidus]|uniref:type II toxin-antitoxin system RelE family toxin n=1 Tax=Mucilaginibacter flavidus TaxID=2949309 RepID=UPI002092216E|nr:type II toxin-antitoxin system RelE/ParE family toxin [Mucilaginibacter flavidus]MCO5950141.1 type II toxin-antitoxin system RelE/ParE family toxin [Mucilaginibacter flavidus]